MKLINPLDIFRPTFFHNPETYFDDHKEVSAKSEVDHDTNEFLRRVLSSMRTRPEDWKYNGCTLSCGEIRIWVANDALTEHPKFFRVEEPLEIDISPTPFFEELRAEARKIVFLSPLKQKSS